MPHTRWPSWTVVPDDSPFTTVATFHRDGKVLRLFAGFEKVDCVGNGGIYVRLNRRAGKKRLTERSDMRVKRLPLLLELKEGCGPVGPRVTGTLRDAIMERRLSPGHAFPSSRDLAVQLGVARNTVLRAIAQLIDEGLLETRQTAGIFVKHQTLGACNRSNESSSPINLTRWAERLPDQTDIRVSTSETLDLKPGLPDLNAISFDEWRRSAARRLKALRTSLASYGPPEGYADLRQEIAQYLGRSRSVLCDANDVIITNGAQQAFDLITRVLIRPGTKLAVEEPGYTCAIGTFGAGGATLFGVPVDSFGLQVASLPDDAELVYVTPSHQFPLGVTLSDERRSELLAWSRSRDAIIVEDDYDSEYRFTSSTLPALRGVDLDGRIIYVGTFSKCLMPGIRLGYMVVPRRLHHVFVKAKCLSDAHSDNISQAVLAEFMSSGAFGRHITKMQKLYLNRHEVLMRTQRDFGDLGATLIPSQGGLHACLLLPAAQREEELIMAAASKGIGLCGLSRFFAATPTFPGLAIGFGNVDANRLESGLSQLRDMLGQSLRTSRRRG